MRIVLADDAVLFREALAGALAGAGLDIVGQAGDAAGLLELVDAVVPDVAIVDVRMPPTRTTEGLEAAVRIREAHPSVGLLILSQDVETRHVIRLLRDTPRGSATCSRTGSATWPSSSMPSRGSGRAARSSIRRSLPRCWGAAARPDRSTS